MTYLDAKKKSFSIARTLRTDHRRRRRREEFSRILRNVHEHKLKCSATEKSVPKEVILPTKCQTGGAVIKSLKSRYQKENRLKKQKWMKNETNIKKEESVVKSNATIIIVVLCDRMRTANAPAIGSRKVHREKSAAPFVILPTIK